MVRAKTTTHALYDNLLLGGDFNSVTSPGDRKTQKLDGTSSHLRRLFDDLHIRDAWREFNEVGTDFTYIDPSTAMRHSRIDLWLNSDSLKSMIKSCTVLQSPAPDHKAIYLDVDVNSRPRGKGYWKLNTNVLNDPLYIKIITEMITETISIYDSILSNIELWEFVKLLIKEYSIKYCAQKARNAKNHISSLEMKLDQLDEQLKSTDDPELITERKATKYELDQLYKNKSKGYQIRSRARWVEEGESSTAYFCRLEKSRQNNNCIKSLKDKAGNAKTTDEDIMDIAYEFYNDLYSTRQATNTEVDNYFDTITPESQLSCNEKDSCEGEITYDECTRAVSKMKENKAPGLDGICSEFYQKMWSVIGNLLVKVFNDCYERGKLSDTQSSAVATLIYKKGKADEIENYRPISLTNVDYKILASILANRMSRVMSTIIKADQTAYMKGRFMGQNIRQFLDVYEDYKCSEKEGIILALDFKKAFDSIEWNFIFRALKFFNFGDSFIRWVNTLYTDPSLFIKNNGYLSRKVKMTRGIRQGCPVSGLLFIIAVEALAIKVRSSPYLNGINIGKFNKHIKISQYADDGILYLNDANEVYTSLNILHEFGYIAGPLLNVNKCEAMQIGAVDRNNRHRNLFGLKWKSSIRCLGIFVGHNNEDNFFNNWSSKLENIKMCLDRWTCRDLTLFGKVFVIKSIALPQIILSATVLTVPPQIIDELNKLFFRFIWGKVERVKRSKLIRSKAAGGLNMIDVKSLFDSFKAAWLPRIMAANPEEDNWVQIPLSIFSIVGGLDIVKYFCFHASQLPLLQSIPAFYKDVIGCYSRAFLTENDTFKQSILNQPLWGNRFITIRKKGKKNVMLLRNWIRSGIRFVKDLIFVGGVLDVDICEQIADKRNIYVEYALVKQALRPYANEISNSLNMDICLECDKKYLNRRSKCFYNYYINSENDNSLISSKFLDDYDRNFDEDIFMRRICLEREKKFQEFNFKLLYGILPCGSNLMKWKIRTHSYCDVCNAEQTILHLLFDCIYTKGIWKHVSFALGWTVEQHNILYGSENDSFQHDNIVITIVCYLIYKEWLLCSLANKSRSGVLNVQSFIYELDTRKSVYEKCKFDVNVAAIGNLLIHLCM